MTSKNIVINDRIEVRHVPEDSEGFVWQIFASGNSYDDYQDRELAVEVAKALAAGSDNPEQDAELILKGARHDREPAPENAPIWRGEASTKPAFAE